MGITVRSGNELESAPSVCRGCLEPPCVDACPSQALRTGTGRGVIFLKERCRGCNICIMVCPFNALGCEGQPATRCSGCEGKPECALPAGPGIESRAKRRLVAEKLAPIQSGGNPWLQR